MVASIYCAFVTPSPRFWCWWAFFNSFAARNPAISEYFDRASSNNNESNRCFSNLRTSHHPLHLVLIVHGSATAIAHQHVTRGVLVLVVVETNTAMCMHSGVWVWVCLSIRIFVVLLCAVLCHMARGGTGPHACTRCFQAPTTWTCVFHRINTNTWGHILLVMCMRGQMMFPALICSLRV